MKAISKKEQWSEIYTWFWYNDNEIFNFTQHDFDEKAKELSERGVTFVMTFSMTHFRFGFYPYWKELTECLRKMTKACHKYNIKIVEHHSAHLTHNLTTKLGWERFAEDVLSYADNSSDTKNWLKFFKFMTADCMIDGKDIRTFAQIDGRTGKPCENVYGAYSLCFNNPEYRETYFNYLKEVIATGIDGIMNDDIQYFGDMNSCTCEHCRKLFREQTGYELPDPEHWNEFFENYDDPAYIAWKKFKLESTSRMYRDLTRFYEDNGYDFLRPNYCSDILKHNPSAYSFDRCTDLWSVIFQENCFSAIMKESYMDFYVESVHRFAAAKRNGVASLSMFYPDRADNAYFGWALARSWGQMYSGTCEGFDTTDLEKPYRDFEKKYAQAYIDPQKLDDVSFLFSRKTRDYTKDALKNYTSKTLACMQSAYVSNLGVDMVFENDSEEELSRHCNIITAYAAAMDDDEIKKLSAYAKNGGRLIIIGDFAVFDSNGKRRPAEEIEALLGVKIQKQGREKLGLGEIVFAGIDVMLDDFQPTVWANRRGETEEIATAVPSKWKMQKEKIGEKLISLIGRPKTEIICDNDRVIATAYKTETALAINLINLADTISEAAVESKHEDAIKNFSENAENVPEIKLSVKLPGGFLPKTAFFCTPESKTETQLCVSVNDGRAEITVPKGLFAGYGLVLLG